MASRERAFVMADVDAHELGSARQHPSRVLAKIGLRRSSASSAHFPLITGSGSTGAGQQPLYNLPIRIAAKRDSSYRLFGERLDLLFGLSLVLRK